jgi:CheY-like chemotaxis protein
MVISPSFFYVTNAAMKNHILILEDNKDLLQLMKEALTDEGYQVTALNYCDSIINTLVKHKPQLVILDFLLHGINGGELCHLIKTNPATGHLPVIIISGYPRVLESLGNYGANSFVAKPFSLNQLLGAVYLHLPLHVVISAFQ